MQFMVSAILPKKRTKFTILRKEDAQDSEFRSVFSGRIEKTKDCFQDLLLDKSWIKKQSHSIVAT